jgi:hypothetical protein
MNYNNVEHIGNYIVLNSVENDNRFIVDTLAELHIKDDIKKDVYGRVSKLLRYFDKYNLIIDTVSLLNKNSRKSKIDSFLSSHYDDIAESFKFNVGSLNYDFEITLLKNSKGITNSCTVLKKGEPYKEFVITDFDKSIKYISKVIDKDKFYFKDFLTSDYLQNSGYSEKELYNLQDVYNTLLCKYDDVKWSTCIIEKLRDDDVSLKLVIQKGTRLLKTKVSRWSSRTAQFNSANIIDFKTVNKNYTSLNSFMDFDEAYKEF